MILHFPLYQVSLRVSGPASPASPSSNSLFLARRICACGRAPALFMCWRGWDEVAGNKKLGGTEMYNYCAQLCQICRP